MRRRFVISILLMVSFLASSVTLAAQTNAASNDWASLRSIASGSKVEVKLKSGKTVNGKMSSASDTTLTLSIKNASQDLQRDDVLSVYQITKKSATKATLIGMGVGAGAGAGIGAAGAAHDNSGFDKIDHVATAGLAVLGAAAGAIAGYLIGRGSTKRVLVYQSR